jgi:hypothetical protein
VASAARRLHVLAHCMPLVWFSSLHQSSADWRLKSRCIEEASAAAHAAAAPSSSHLHRSRHKQSILSWSSICLMTRPRWISRQTRTGGLEPLELSPPRTRPCITTHICTRLVYSHSSLLRARSLSTNNTKTLQTPIYSYYICITYITSKAGVKQE